MTSATPLFASDGPDLAAAVGARTLAWAPDVVPATAANPIPPLLILILGSAAILIVSLRPQPAVPRSVQGHHAQSRQATSRIVVGIAALWALLLSALVVTCAIVGNDGSIGYSGSAFTVAGEPYYGSVTAEGFPSWGYAVGVLIGLVMLGGVTFFAVRRGQAWLATVIGLISVGATLTAAAIAAGGPITELTALTSHSPDPPAWTAVGEALIATAYVALAITVAASTFALIRPRPAAAPLG